VGGGRGEDVVRGGYRSSILEEVVDVVDDSAVASKGAGFVVLADVAETDDRAEVPWVARQTDTEVDSLNGLVAKEPVHLVTRGNDTVGANHLDCARGLTPRDSEPPAADLQFAVVRDGCVGLLRQLFGC
jgi:hypothetical protein